MERIIYSEKEAILFCIEKKIHKSESRMKTYLRLGKLDGKSSINSLTKDMLLFYKNVYLGQDENGKALKGTDRTYVCEGLRDVPLEKTTKHVGTQVSPEQDSILMEYVFNKLLENETTKGYTHKTWSDILEIHNTDDIIYKDLVKIFQEYYSINESRKVTRGLINRLDDVRGLIIEGSFNKLVKAKRITQNEAYFTKKKDKQGSRSIATEVSKETFMSIQDRMRELAEENGITYKQYVGYNRSTENTSSSMNKIATIIRNTISDEFHVDGIFIGYRIRITKRKKQSNVSKEMMKQAYFEKLVALTERNLKNQNSDKEKNKYIQTGYVEKEFAAFNVFLLIHYHLGELDLQERLLELLPTGDQIEEVQNIHRQHGIDKANKEAERVRNSPTFIIGEE